MTTDKLQFAKEILLVRPRNCDNCWHNRTGHCSMYSVNCATDVSNRISYPSWWTSYEDGEDAERAVIGGRYVRAA